MMKPVFRTAILALALSIGPVTAEDISADALTAGFATHLKNAQKTRSLDAKPKHRGLSLVTGGTQEIEFEPVEPGTEINIRVGFDFDSDALRTDQLGQLTPLCDAMNALAKARFRIIGHTDASGEGGYNDNLSLRRPEMAFDLPGGARRLLQKSRGYDATIVAGQVTMRDGEITDARPGRLIRGAQAKPA